MSARLWKAGLVMWIASCALRAQDGQPASRPGWPCVAGRAVDPAYLEISEGTGGQLFLFQKGEVAQSGLVMDASRTHPSTILRSVGHLNGSRDFEFPVDSGVESLLVLVSLQCRNTIRIVRPGGSELTQMNSDVNVDLQAGRIVRLDRPEPGRWRLQLAGTGLFVLSVLARTDLVLSGVVFSKGDSGGLEVRGKLRGEASDVKVELVDAAGSPLSKAEVIEFPGDDLLRAGFPSTAQRFRVRVTGRDGNAHPFQRTHPILFKP